jgi:hypothetical protein
VAGTYLLKLQHLQNKAIRTTGNFPRCTPVRNLHTVFNLLYVYDYITKLCRQQAEVILNHENEYVCSIGQGKEDKENIRGLNLAAVKHMTIQVTDQTLVDLSCL